MGKDDEILGENFEKGYFMKHLWAPWRMEYILEEKQKGCIFCKKPMEKRDEENLILYQNQYAFVMMNKFPYTNGHVMVVPKCHCANLSQLKDKEGRELLHLMKASLDVLKKTLRPHGFNIGMNLGRIGGAGVERHLHFHIVPRWIGDTNFMPILGETKVVPEYLEKTYQKLHSAFKGVSRKGKGQKGGQKR